MTTRRTLAVVTASTLALTALVGTGAGSSATAVGPTPHRSDIAPARTLTGVSAGADIAGMDVDGAGRVYVATKTGQVRVHAAGARGAAAPVRTIGGPATGLRHPAGIAVAPDGTVYLVDYEPTVTVRVFGPDASGDVEPDRVIVGPTHVADQRSVALGPDGTVLVVSDDDGPNGRVYEFARDASGPSTPIRTLRGARTDLVSPMDVAVGPDGDLYVSEWNVGAVNVFDARANGDVAPVRRIPSSRLWQAARLELDARGNIYVGAYWDRGSVVVFSAGTVGDAPPANVVTGPRSRIDEPWDLAVQPDGTLFVANYATDEVTVYAPLVRPARVRELTVRGKKKAKKRRITWRPPTGDTGRSLTGYELTVRKGMQVRQRRTLGVSTTSVTVNRRVLRSGRHHVEVAAVNAAGPGSAASRAFGVAKIRPAKVRALKVRGGKAAQRRTVRWKAPAWDGGARVARYRVVVRKGGRTLLATTVASRTRRVKVPKDRLRSGRHRVVVRAQNAKGLGPKRTKVFRVRR